jgi:asparagine synthase (glutamine-hydrolysing)
MSAMRHRGPDDEGSFVDESGVALGHIRLSIIDLSAGGHQPMIDSANGDVLSFNGEIYNFRDLRTELAAKGYAFRSSSDTEVLLYAIAEWGIECLNRLNGMFAFALWRPSERALYLARDPLGIKPLYYWPRNGWLAFSSEMKALMRLPGFVGKADNKAIGQFLEFGYTFDVERTIFAGVSKLPPGHYLRVTPDGSYTLCRYFNPAPKPDNSVDQDGLEQELHTTLSTVVREHLIADVPVALLLSGGLDSSLLASMASRQTQISTISMGFARSAVDERRFAREVAAFIGSQHGEVVIEPEQVEQTVWETIGCFDDLFADWGTVTTRLLYRKCRERGIKVVIVGEGADEIFGGYDIFKMSQSDMPIDLWLFQVYRRYSGRRYGKYYSEFRRIMRGYLKEADGDRFAAIRMFETCCQLPNNYINKVDRASMSVSVEARVPFLDRRITQLAFKMPASLLLRHQEKQILRDMASRYRLLPEHIARRPKYGGSIAASWMDEQPSFRQFASDIILQKGGWTDALGLHRPMSAFFVKNRQGYPFPHPLSISRNLAWRLLLLELWSKAFKVAPHAS